MRTIFNLLAAICLFSTAAQADDIAFVRFVNAISPGHGNTRLDIDGEDVFPKGYAPGQRSGGIGLKAGPHTITVARQGVDPGKTRLTVTGGETVTLVAFAEKLPARRGKPERWGVRILRLKQRDAGNGYRLTLLNVSREPELTVDIHIPTRAQPETTSVKRLMTATADLGKGGEIVIRRARTKTDLATFHPDDPGNYILILHDGEDGELRAIHFHDPKFVVAG